MIVIGGVCARGATWLEKKLHIKRKGKTFGWGKKIICCVAV